MGSLMPYQFQVQRRLSGLRRLYSGSLSLCYLGAPTFKNLTYRRMLGKHHVVNDLRQQEFQKLLEDGSAMRSYRPSDHSCDLHQLRSYCRLVVPPVLSSEKCACFFKPILRCPESFRELWPQT